MNIFKFYLGFLLFYSSYLCVWCWLRYYNISESIEADDPQLSQVQQQVHVKSLPGVWQWLRVVWTVQTLPRWPHLRSPTSSSHTLIHPPLRRRLVSWPRPHSLLQEKHRLLRYQQTFWWSCPWIIKTFPYSHRDSSLITHRPHWGR